MVVACAWDLVEKCIEKNMGFLLTTTVCFEKKHIIAIFSRPSLPLNSMTNFFLLIVLFCHHECLKNYDGSF